MVLKLPGVSETIHKQNKIISCEFGESSLTCSFWFFTYIRHGNPQPSPIFLRIKTCIGLMFWDPRAHMFWISNVQTKKLGIQLFFSKHQILIGSMRLVYLPTIHLGTYASPMDPMGIGKCERMFFSSQTGSSFLWNALCNGSSLVFFSIRSTWKHYI